MDPSKNEKSEDEEDYENVWHFRSQQTQAEKRQSMESGYCSKTVSVKSCTLSEAAETAKNIAKDHRKKEAIKSDPKDQVTDTLSVGKDGGFFILDQLNVSLSFPYSASCNSQISVTQKLCPTNYITLKDKIYHLLTRIYEFGPHGLEFGKKVVVQIPLDKVIQCNSSDVRLLYSNTDKNEPMKWQCYPDNDHHIKDGILPSPPSLSWAVMGSYCYIYLSHFCLVTLAQQTTVNTDYENINNNNDGSGDDEDSNHGNYDNYAFEHDDNENIVLNNTRSSSSGRSCHNQGSVQYENGPKRKVKSTVKTSKKSNQSGYVLLYVSPSWDDTLVLKFNVCLSSTLDDGRSPETSQGHTPESVKKYQYPVCHKLINIDPKCLELRFFSDSPSFQPVNGQMLQMPLNITDTSDLPSQTFYIRELGISSTRQSHFFVHVYEIHPEQQSICPCFPWRKRSRLLAQLDWQMTEQQMKRFIDLRDDNQNDYNNIQATPQRTPDDVHNAHQTEYNNLQLAEQCTHGEVHNALITNSSKPYIAGIWVPQIVQIDPTGHISAETRECLSQEFCEVVETQLVSSLDPGTLQVILNKMGIEYYHNMNVELLTRMLLMNKSIEPFKQLYHIILQQNGLNLAQILKYEIEKETIRKKLIVISEKMDLLASSLLYNKLFSQEVISLEQKETLNCINTDIDKASYIIRIVLKSDKNKLTHFKNVLQESGHTHVLEMFSLNKDFSS